jgi:hypothetical protein
MAGMFGGGSASDGGASQSAAQVVGKLLERIMTLLRQSESLQPALRKLQALQSSVSGGVLGSALEGAESQKSRAHRMRLEDGLSLSARSPGRVGRAPHHTGTNAHMEGGPAQHDVDVGKKKKCVGSYAR